MFWKSTAVSYAGAAFLFGGEDPIGGLTAKVLAQLPTGSQRHYDGLLGTPRARATAVLVDGESGPAFVFGGIGPTGGLDEVGEATLSWSSVTYSPISARLPTPRWSVGGAYDGSRVVLVGGESAAGALDEILHFDPGTRTFTVSPLRLPHALSGALVASDRTFVYIIGGGGAASSGARCDIYRYHPVEFTLVKMNAAHCLRDGAAAWDGENVLMMGGQHTGPRRFVAKYDPVQDRATEMAATLHGAGAFAAGVWTGTEAWIFGGSASWACCLEVDVWQGKPGVPSLVRVNPGPGAGEVTAQWWGPDDRTYSHTPLNAIAYVSVGSGPFVATAVGPVNGLATIGGFGAGVAVSVRVEMRNDLGVGPQSSPEAVTTFTYPEAPRNVVARRGVDYGELEIAWQPPAWDGGLAIAAYRVYGANEPSGPFTHVGSASGTSFTDRGLPHAQTRHYLVTALTGVGEGAASAGAAATTIQPPGPPVDLDVVTGPGRGELSLSWAAPSDDGGHGLTGYRIAIAPSPEGAFAEVGLAWVTGSFVARGLPDDSAFWLRVAGEHGAGVGAWSAASPGRTAAVPSAPIRPDARLAIDGVEVSWAAPSSDGGVPLLGYSVERGPAPDGPFAEVAVTTGLSFLDALPPQALTAYYRVSAFNVVGAGSPSNSTSVFELDDVAEGRGSGPVASPGVEPVPLITPGVVIPGVCALSGCPSVFVPGAEVPLTPAVEPVAVMTPAVPHTCLVAGVLVLACVGPVAALPIAATPGVSAITLNVPGAAIPSACELLVQCPGPTAVAPPLDLGGTPGLSPQTVSSGAGASVATSRVGAFADPGAGRPGNVGPLEIGPEGVPITLCPAGCTLPASPRAGAFGRATVSVEASDNGVSPSLDLGSP